MTWQTEVDQWLAANPNSTDAERQQAATSAGLTYNPATGTVSYGNESYAIPPAITQVEKSIRSGVFDPMIQQWMQNPNAAIANASSVNWAGGQAGGYSALDDWTTRMLNMGMNPTDVLNIARAYGVTPETFSNMAPTMNIGDVANLSKLTTGDQWVNYLLSNKDFTLNTPDVANFSRSWLSAPYANVAGQGDMYAGMRDRGYKDPFTREVLQGEPSSLAQANLSALTFPYFNVNDPFRVTALNQDPKVIRDQLSSVLGTKDMATLNEAANYLYGISSLPAFSNYTPGSWTAGPGKDPSTGVTTQPIPTFNTDLSSPFSGRNWRDTILSGTGYSGRAAYDYIKSKAASGNATLSSLQRDLGLNPGEIQAIYDEAIEYAQSHNLAVPLMPAVTTANRPYYGYGYGPARAMYTRSTGGENVVNPLAAYLEQIYDQRNAAEGGYIKKAGGGLTDIQKDPVIHRYIKGGMSGGQDDNVNAMLSDGEYVMDADVVAALGDGNSDEGARKLDKMRENIRRHKRSASPKSIPPKAKNPEQYLKGTKNA